ncbi:hypothetical protein [uncultured Roseobacter sp.]|uniref:hypothetical protein n=1 Tax=uncultured Roseobacter sp. TaxID=114847 RepID=UPI00260B7B92|nr:hypothetical protein [uncultured Roseobacter sp.]
MATLANVFIKLIFENPPNVFNVHAPSVPSFAIAVRGIIRKQHLFAIRPVETDAAGD